MPLNVRRYGRYFLNVKLFLVSLYQLFEVGKSLQQTENRTVAFSLPYPI